MQILQSSGEFFNLPADLGITFFCVIFKYNFTVRRSEFAAQFRVRLNVPNNLLYVEITGDRVARTDSLKYFFQ